MGASAYSRRERKIELANKCLIRCGICPVHRNENWEKTDYKCWKTYRKSQYRHLATVGLAQGEQREPVSIWRREAEIEPCFAPQGPGSTPGPTNHHLTACEAIPAMGYTGWLPRDRNRAKETRWSTSSVASSRRFSSKRCSDRSRASSLRGDARTRTRQWRCWARDTAMRRVRAYRLGNGCHHWTCIADPHRWNSLAQLGRLAQGQSR